MQMSDAVRIEASADAVFGAMVDPSVLRASIPGCQEMSGSLEDGFEAVVRQKVGPVSATFRGVVTIEEMDRPRSLVISGEGKGGPAGFAKGGAKVVLTPEDSGTRLFYDVDAKVGGKLAQLGGRVIDGVAKRMADQFFQDFKAAVEGAGAGGAAVEGAGAGVSAQAASDAVPAADASEPVVEAEGPRDPVPADAVEKKKGLLGRIFG